MPAKTPAKRTHEEELYAEAIASAEPLIREVYEAQQARARMGEVEYDPYRKARVVFVPAVRGGYVAELHPVELDDIRKAQLDGADYWDTDRGWIRRGKKAELDPGTPIRRPQAVVEEPTAPPPDVAANEE